MVDYRRLISGAGVGDEHERKDEELLSQQPHAKRWRFSLLVQLYIAILATVVCALQITSRTRLTCASSEPAAISTDNYVLTTFQGDVRYMSLHRSYDYLWEFGGQNSTLRVPEPVLGTGEEVDATISMFHQLHCLSSFRKALQNAREGGETALDYRFNGHWPHCLDYLRNAILCFADGTLELPRIIDGKRANFIDGAQDRRQCRSAKALYDQHPGYVQFDLQTT